jgi:hypothetical protein
MSLFTSFEQWRAAITGPCGLTLAKDYCETRIAALNNPSDSSTKAFIDAYGEPYRDTVVAWFTQAAQLGK